MRKGTVISAALSHKNGSKILVAGDKVSEADVNNFAWCVKTGHVKEDIKEVEESELMKLKKDELQAKCDELKIEYSESDTKAELVELIENKEAI